MTRTKEKALEAARGWEEYADQVESQTQWNRSQGIDLCPPGLSPGDHKAKAARDCAKALRLEAETGVLHCNCHLVPYNECPKQIKMTQEHIRGLDDGRKG